MASSEPTVEQSFFIDKNVQFDINAIEGASFKDFEKRLNLGYQTAPIWIRMRIVPPVSTTAADAGLNQMILRIGPHDADQIAVYEFDRGQWQVQTVGDIFPLAGKSCADDYYCINLRETTSPSNIIYLKIQTTNFLILDTEIVTVKNLSSVTGNRIKRIFISLTLASVLLAIGIFWVIKYRSSMTACFVGVQASIFIYLLSIYGFPSIWFPDWPPVLLDALPHLMFILRSFFSILTIFVVIKTYCDSRFYFTMVYAILMVCLLNCVLFFTEYKNFSVRLNLVIFSIYPAIHLFGVVKSKGMIKNVRVLFFVSFFLFYVVLLPTIVGGIFFSFFNGFVGPIQNISDWRLNGLMVGAVIFLLIKFEEEHREKLKAEELNQIRIDRIEADSYAALLSDRNTMIDLLTHDLKNPLGTITFASRALKEQLQGNQMATQKLRHIDQCVNRMNGLIEHVAVSARLDRYESVTSPMFSLAAELIEELTETYADQSRFHINVEANVGFTADREMLTVVFGNLINNAYKYGHAGGEITIKVKRTSNATSADTIATGPLVTGTDAVYFEISNAVGTFGMPDQDRVFERYYRHPNSIAVPGMGLGLSLVKAAAAKIGASVDFRHDRDTVTFTVKVPH
jgi:two-component system, sensor histidine kinase LadS